MSKSISKTVITEIEIEKSKFICTLIPVNSNDTALENLNELRYKYRDATHNCYAYVLNGGSIQRCSDDGEPAKTAGYPILQAIMNNELDNVLCVVTRYFGGVKLGAGGLVRAYNASAMESINTAEIVEYHNSISLEITFDFTFINPIENTLNKFNLDIVNKEYLDQVTYEINVIETELDQLKSSLINITKNTVIFSNENSKFISR